MHDMLWMEEIEVGRAGRAERRDRLVGESILECWLQKVREKSFNPMSELSTKGSLL